MINILDLVEQSHQALDVVPGAMNLWKEGISCRKKKRKKKEKHKMMYPFAKETFVSKKRRVKENKAKARKRRRERADKNCERVFSAISHS